MAWQAAAGKRQAKRLNVGVHVTAAPDGAGGMEAMPQPMGAGETMGGESKAA